MPLDARALGPHHVGEYEVLAKIAEGGMGAVYKARHPGTGQFVAIKVLPITTAKNPVLMRRFEQEYRAAAAIDHPNIVRALDFCGNCANPFLVMEFVDGESLGAKVDRDGPMTEEQAIRIIAQVCQGLHKAHKLKMVHRDVKPDNILVTAEGVAKLTDLGLVKDAENELNLTKTGRGLGTPNYMAPEQFRDAKNADVRCDIYSLGATLYTLLTAETPFGKVGPLDCWMRKQRNDLPAARELNPAVSERVSWAIQRAMSGDPAKRPASCKEFVEDLTGVSIRPSNYGAEPPSHDSVPAADLWYLVYRDDEGETHTVKGTTDAIRKALKDGLLGDASNVRAGRSKTGQFLVLSAYPEFRDLVIAPAPMPSTSTPVGQAMRQTPVPRTSTPLTPPPGGAPRRSDPESVDYTPAPRAVNYYDPTEDYRPVGESTTIRPLIPVAQRPAIEDDTPRRMDWLFWGGVLVVALATALGVVFLPQLIKF